MYFKEVCKIYSKLHQMWADMKFVLHKEIETKFE